MSPLQAIINHLLALRYYVIILSLEATQLFALILKTKHSVFRLPANEN